jgi:hypothetical protein
MPVVTACPLLVRWTRACLTSHRFNNIANPASAAAAAAADTVTAAAGAAAAGAGVSPFPASSTAPRRLLFGVQRCQSSRPCFPHTPVLSSTSHFPYSTSGMVFKCPWCPHGTPCVLLRTSVGLVQQPLPCRAAIMVRQMLAGGLAFLFCL